MNVIQRKALADAVGLEASELSKLVTGQAKVNKLTTQSVMAVAGQLTMFVGLGTLLGGIIGMLTLGKATPFMAGGAAKGAGIGAALGGTAFGAMKVFEGLGILPKAQTGGVVRETGMAVVHKGETIAGTQFGGRESNNLLRELIKQNSTLMNRLTNKVGDLALSQ